MANVTWTVQDARRSSNGLNVTDNDTAVTSSDTYYFANDGSIVLVITNDAGSNTVTVETPNTLDALAITDLTATIAANKCHVLGPFPTGNYNNSDGNVKVTFSAAASVMAIRVD